MEKVRSMRIVERWHRKVRFRATFTKLLPQKQGIKRINPSVQNVPCFTIIHALTWCPTFLHMNAGICSSAKRWSLSIHRFLSWLWSRPRYTVICITLQGSKSWICQAGISTFDFGISWKFLPMLHELWTSVLSSFPGNKREIPQKR